MFTSLPIYPCFSSAWQTQRDGSLDLKDGMCVAVQRMRKDLRNFHQEQKLWVHHAMMGDFKNQCECRLWGLIAQYLNKLEDEREVQLLARSDYTHMLTVCPKAATGIKNLLLLFASP